MVRRTKKVDRSAVAWARCLPVVVILSILFAPSGGCKTMELSGKDAQGDPQPLHKGSKILRSEDLVVEVMDPNDPDRYNRGVRFTPVGAVLRVSMNGDEFLFSSVEHNPIAEHAGLAAEFDLTTQGGPPGYAEAKAGEGFVKVGVGVLKKTGGPYGFWNKYELIEPAKTTVKWTAAAADFDQTCKGPNGYAYELSAKVKVEGKTVAVEWTLANAGTKPFETHQYAHNFFRFNDRPVGPDYVLSFPYGFKAEGLGKEQKQVGREILFAAEIPQAVNITVPYPEGYEGANELTVKHTKTGQTLHCVTSVPGMRTAVHASKKYLCPEQFISLKLSPGDKTTWTRAYTFGRKAD